MALRGISDERVSFKNEAPRAPTLQRGRFLLGYVQRDYRPGTDAIGFEPGKAKCNSFGHGVIGVWRDKDDLINKQGEASRYGDGRRLMGRWREMRGCYLTGRRAGNPSAGGAQKASEADFHRWKWRDAIAPTDD